jgi:hypothetical protein
MKKQVQKHLLVFLSSILLVPFLSGCDLLSDFGSAAASWGAGVGSAIQSWGEGVGSAVGSWVSETGQKLTSAAEDLWANAQTVTRNVGDWANGVFDSAKTTAAYVYDQASSATQEGYNRAKEKADSLIGNVSDFVANLNGTSTYTEKFGDFDEEHPVKDLAEGVSPNLTGSHLLNYQYEVDQFVDYEISSILSARGYNVYNGAAYYKGNVYGGLIFTDNEVFAQEEGKDILAAGFLQLVPSGYTGDIIDETKVETGLIAVAPQEGNEAFVIDKFASFDDFSGIYNDYFFRCHQSSNYVMEILEAKDEESLHDSSIELYDFNQDKYVYTAPAPAEGTTSNLFVSHRDSFNGAVNTVNAIKDYCDNDVEQDEVSTLVVLDNKSVDSMVTSAESDVDKTKENLADQFKGMTVDSGEIVSVSNEGKTGEVKGEASVDEARVTDGIISTVGSTLATVGGVVSVVVCAAAAGPVIKAIVITTGACAVVYGISNIIAGVEDIYYGSKGSTTASVNPVLTAFQAAFGKDTGTTVYHVWGIANTIVAGLMMPVSKSLAISKAANLNVFRTAINVVRASLVTIAKGLVASATGALIGKLTTYIVTAISGNQCLGKLIGFGVALITSFVVYGKLDSIDKKINASGLYPKEGTKTEFQQQRQEQQENVYRHDVRSLSQGEREEAVRGMVDQASDSYGIQNKPEVRFIYDDTQPDLCGFYSRGNNTITVNMASSDSTHWSDLADTIGHEMRHCYQWENCTEGDAMYHSLTDGYLNPESTGVSYTAYRNQLCESDAFKWGDIFSQNFMAWVSSLA